MSSTYGGDGRVLDSKVVSPYHPSADPYFRYEVHFDSAGRPVDILGTSAAWTTYPAAESMYQASGYDALGRPTVMKADVGKAVSTRTYSSFSGRLTAECKRLEAGITCGTTGLDATKDILRTDKGAEASYEGSKLKSYVEYLGSTSNTTTYTTTYLPSGRVSSTSAVKGGTAQPATQEYSEAFTYDGIGNIASVAGTRNTTISGRTPVRRNEAYTPVLGQQSGTVIDQVNKVTDTGTAVGRSALQVRYGYDLSNRLVSVTRSAGSSETLDYGPSGELSHRRVDGKDVFYVGEYATVTASNCVQDPPTPTYCTSSAAVNSVAVDAHLIYAGTRIASARKASLDGLTSGRTLYYYRTRLGSVIATSLRGGTKGALYRYTPYGEIDRTDENDNTRSDLGYTNALRLSGGLIHLVNRAYDPEAKVFVQADVVDRLRYAYATGDPTNRSDPTGLASIRSPVDQMVRSVDLKLADLWLKFQRAVGLNKKTDKTATPAKESGGTPVASEEKSQNTGTGLQGNSGEGHSEPARAASIAASGAVQTYNHDAHLPRETNPATGAPDVHLRDHDSDASTPSEPYQHTGEDVGVGPVGSAVHSPFAGTVQAIGYNELSGHFLYIDNFTGGSRSGFAHVEPAAGLSVGDTVAQGQQIGSTSNSGNVVGNNPPVHYILQLNGGGLVRGEQLREVLRGETLLTDIEQTNTP